MSAVCYIIIVALLVNGVNVTTWQNMVFGWLGRWIEQQHSKPILMALLKPIIACVWCMPPWYAVFMNWYFQDFSTAQAFLLGIAAIPVSGYIATKFENL